MLCYKSKWSQAVLEGHGVFLGRIWAETGNIWRWFSWLPYADLTAGVGLVSWKRLYPFS